MNNASNTENNAHAKHEALQAMILVEVRRAFSAAPKATWRVNASEATLERRDYADRPFAVVLDFSAYHVDAVRAELRRLVRVSKKM